MIEREPGGRAARARLRGGDAAAAVPATSTAIASPIASPRADGLRLEAPDARAEREFGRRTNAADG